MKASIRLSTNLIHASFDPPGWRRIAARRYAPAGITAERTTDSSVGGAASNSRCSASTTGRSPPRIGRKPEGDLIVGARQQSAVATLVERKMRLTLLIRLPRGHSAQHFGDALITTFSQLPVMLRKTLTWDQGNEMFHHERIEAATGVRIYFADPHSPWQRGSNENQRACAPILTEGYRPRHVG